ncbi:MAG TPA: hypothetical protein VMD02_00610, partial [Candidatus Omnitrophota bacterium]|nr:hypothetical protein [Candidatus Omnitrophota bacterium]
LLKALAHGVKKLDKLGVHATIFVPIEEPGKPLIECNWKEFYRPSTSGGGTYASPEGALPEDTLLSVIQSRQACFNVNIESPESFTDQGIEFNRSKIAHDFARTKGSPEIWIYRMESVARSPEAVIYIRNRVPCDHFNTPPANLFPVEDARLIAEELSLYFNDEVANVFSVIRQRAQDNNHVEEKRTLSPSEKMAMLRYGQPMTFNGQRIRLYEVPSEKFYRNLDGVIDWLRDSILSVYEGTRIASGKTKPQLIKDLSLEDERMKERAIYARYLAVVEGERPNEHNIRGVMAGNVYDLNGGVGMVFKVPEAMIHPSARGHKLQVALSFEMISRVVKKRWADMGLWNGFFYMLFKGVPFYATTQSLRVVKDMMRLKDLSIIRVVKDRPLSAIQRKVIEFGSGGTADGRGVQLNAYGGRIAIDEEEKGIVLRKPAWITTLPVVRWLFTAYHRQIERENEAIVRFFKNELGKRGRMHLVGHFTIGVALKVWFELTIGSWFRHFTRKTHRSS